MARARTSKPRTKPKLPFDRSEEFLLGYKTALVETFHEFRRENSRAIHTDNTELGIKVLEAMAKLLKPNAGVVDLYTGGGRQALIVSPERKIQLWEELTPHFLATGTEAIDRYTAKIQRKLGGKDVF